MTEKKTQFWDEKRLRDCRCQMPSVLNIGLLDYYNMNVVANDHFLIISLLNLTNNNLDTLYGFS
jgi:hypothetical protein